MRETLTVVMLNWARPLNVEQFALNYLKMPEVEKVIVFSNSGAVVKSPLVLPPDPRCVHVQCNQDLGLYTRYAIAACAPTEAVLLVDDDIVIPAETVTALFKRWQEDRRVLHGLFGRSPAENGTYTVRTVYGSCEIVLTRCVMTTRFLCARALANGTKILPVHPGVPLGNGEDIVMSYTANAITGRANRAYSLPYSNLGFDDDNAISVRFKMHVEHRTSVVQWCRKHVTD